MTEHVVQVARDAFALGHRGQGDVLFLCMAQLQVCALALRNEQVADAHDDGEEAGNRVVEWIAGEDSALSEESEDLDDHGGDEDQGGLDAEGKQRRNVDEKAGAADVEGNGGHAEYEDGADEDEPGAS